VATQLGFEGEAPLFGALVEPLAEGVVALFVL
jgi:hypothetical protein